MKPARYALLDLYLGSFCARRDAYVRDSRAHIPEPLTPEVAEAAFGVGGFSVSGYMAERTGEATVTMTHVGAIDFDTEEGFEQARAVRSFLDTQQGIPSMLVASRRGAHLWVTTIGNGKHDSDVVGMVPAVVVRRALKMAISLCGYDLPKVEIFPKASHSDWGVGALRLPLMRHPKTGVRYPAYDPFDDAEVTGVLSVVNLMADLQMATPYDALYALSGGDMADASWPGRYGAVARPRPPRGDVRVTDLLAERFGMTVMPGHSVRCPFHDDQRASLSISLNDQRCWCKAPTCVLFNDDTGVGSIELRDILAGKEPSDVAPRGQRDA